MPTITQVVKRTGAIVPFNQGRITNAIYRAAVAVGGRDRSLAEGLSDRVVAMLEETTPEGHIPTVEEIQNVVEVVLIETGHARTAKAYILYRNERTRLREQRAERDAASGSIPWRKVYEALSWAVDHDLHTVESLNARMARGEFADIVHEANEAYERDILFVAQTIEDRGHGARAHCGVKVVIVAGPSSSGKTTTTIKLSQALRDMGLSLVPLTVDHYFYDLALHPKDEHGDYDYETPQALDLALIDEHLTKLVAGEEVRIPLYDFKTGRQYRDHTPMRLAPNEIILIDSLHGLYADMTQHVEPEQKFKVYIEPLLQMKGPDSHYLRWSDLRLMRRMERDAAHRAYDPRRTLEHWHYVRASELHNIIPYVNTVDHVVNSSLPYELPVMRRRLFASFTQWVQDYRDDPLRRDAFQRAERVHRLLQAVTPVEDESLIPADALLREFIGVAATATNQEASVVERELVLVCARENDLYQVLVGNRIPCVDYSTPIMAVQRAQPGAGVLVLADGYPDRRLPITDDVLALVSEKNLRLYFEYPASLPGHVLGEPRGSKWERAVVASDWFGDTTARGRILGIHSCRFVPTEALKPHIVMARVAGFDTAVFGLPETDVYPILFEVPKQHLMVATTKLSHFLTARFAPFEDWKAIWTTILNWVRPETVVRGLDWGVPLVQPSYAKDELLPDVAEEQAFERGAEWFDKGRLFVHTDWRDKFSEADAFEDRVCPFPKPDWPVGDGSLGMLEGYNAAIQHDGTQPLRWWLRNDCMGEAAMPLALWGEQTGNPRGRVLAANLLEFIYRDSALAQGPRADPASPSYGLVGWSVPQNEGVYYGDDNARAILGSMAAAALLNEDRWDEAVMRNLLANLRTTGTLGFRRQRIEEHQLQASGWKKFFDEPYVFYGPHYEAYLWACFLRAYALANYAPFLERTRKAIRMTVEAYPDEWQWTNGIQQERARMLLPLAWLVRVADTPEHRQWLRTIAEAMLAHQDACGAIREQVGERGKGAYAPYASNAAYGTNEAPLIQENGDALSDLLYTTNFAFIGLHEAAAATGEPLYVDAEERLAKYLCRIQVRSRAHPELDGAWFRAHDFNRWEYWASNGDAGWGAWSIESGWTQAWITTVLGMRLARTSLWEVTAACGFGRCLPALLPVMGM